ncbi:MAG: DNA adenine methylase [Spirochaetaceae bacterium]|nr:DNA adenine methylase [Spirochaetaceae bacterium]
MSRSRAGGGASALPGPPGYCSGQLIPYLGNKRSLLPRLYPVLDRLAAGRAGPQSFADAFAGSGAVSRLARAMGFRVASNDWEPYSQAIGRCWLALRPADLDEAFGGAEGLAAFLGDWNAMHPESGEPYAGASEPYIARWYAPERTDAPRLDEERLFYTAENAAFIDRVRERIEYEYPSPEPGSPGEVRRRVAMGALLLEAAVHTNTSGVFKAYHRGFGGHGKDALGRILGRMELEAPVLPDAPPAEVYGLDAAAFMSGRVVDVAYFDPPYNQHQYGPNYHLLNTILAWDREPRPMAASETHSSKAGIPVDWKERRSRFCVKREAAGAIRSLLDASDAGVIVFSWNADGHLSGEDMAALLAPRGRLDIVALDYVSYRGGRQSASRSARSREYLFVVDTRAAATDEERARRSIADLAAQDEALRSSYDPERVRSTFFGQGAPWPEAGAFFGSGMRRAADEAERVLLAMPEDRRGAFRDALAGCACSSVSDELDALLAAGSGAMEAGDRRAARSAGSKALRYIRKLAHDKYAAEFDRYARAFSDIADACGDDATKAGLAELAGLIERRKVAGRSG